MFKKVLLVALAACVVLIACGGGGPDKATMKTVQPVAFETPPSPGVSK